MSARLDARERKGEPRQRGGPRDPTPAEEEAVLGVLAALMQEGCDRVILERHRNTGGLRIVREGETVIAPDH